MESILADNRMCPGSTCVWKDTYNDFKLGNGAFSDCTPWLFAIGKGAYMLLKSYEEELTCQILVRSYEDIADECESFHFGDIMVIG